MKAKLLGFSGATLLPNNLSLHNRALLLILLLFGDSCVFLSACCEPISLYTCVVYVGRLDCDTIFAF